MVDLLLDSGAAVNESDNVNIYEVFQIIFNIIHRKLDVML